MPGDRVDVMVHLVRDPAREIQETVTRTILQDIKVFAVDDVVDLEKEKDSSRKIAAKTISLLVTPEQAAKVMLATQLGTINLVMRSPEDDQQIANAQARPGELFAGPAKADRDKETLLPADPNLSEKTKGFLDFLNSSKGKASPGAATSADAVQPARDVDHAGVEAGRRSGRGVRGRRGEGCRGFAVGRVEDDDHGGQCGRRASAQGRAETPTSRRRPSNHRNRTRRTRVQIETNDIWIPHAPHGNSRFKDDPAPGRLGPDVHARNTRMCTRFHCQDATPIRIRGLRCRTARLSTSPIPRTQDCARRLISLAGCCCRLRSARCWPLAALAQQPSTPSAKPSVIFKVHGPSERLEMTVHTSRILTMDQKIPQAQVNNPDILELTPLSPNQIQVSAKTAGVTQINLWGEDQKLYTVDVIVYGDAKELEMVLRSAFPTAALKVTPVANAVMISGFVDQPERIERIIRIAEEYYPKVINNMTVGGCQQVLLHVKVMEVSRTKLRRLGFDFSNVNGPNVVTSAPMGLLANAINSTPVPSTPPIRRRRGADRQSTGRRHVRLRHRQRQQRVFRRAGCLAGRRLGKDPGGANADDRQRPARLLQVGRIVLHYPERTEWRRTHHGQVRNAGRLRADRIGQRANPPGRPVHYQRDRPKPPHRPTSPR